MSIRRGGCQFILLLVIAAAVGDPGVAVGSERILHLANRPEFIADDTVQKFEAETGITVTYDVYATDTELLDKLRAGNPRQWDLVVASLVPGLADGAAAHLFRAVERAHLPNYGNLDPDLLAVAARIDPENGLAVPYLWGTFGLVIQPDRLKTAAPDAPGDSLALLFDPHLAAEAGACGVAVEDDAEAAIDAALLYLGLDPAAATAADLERAGELWRRVRIQVRRYDPESFVQALAAGRICAGFGRSDDVADARSRIEETVTGVTLSYVIPRERSPAWMDVLAIPASAAGVAEAHAFIDFILRPEIISNITDWTGAANPNLLATDFVDDDKTDETIFPTSAARARLVFTEPLTPEALAARSRLWSKLRP